MSNKENKTVVYKYKNNVLIETLYPVPPSNKPAKKNKKEVKGEAKRKSKKDFSLQEEDTSSPEEAITSSQ